MPKIVIGLVVFLAVMVVPPLRRAVLSLLGLLAIVVVGSSAFAGVIWALYETKPWLTGDGPGVVQEVSTPDEDKAEPNETAEADLASALADEEAQRIQDEKQRLEDEKLRITITAARARVILEEDRKLAAQAASYPLPPGIDDRLGDLMAIRVPAWRDKEVATAQKAAIRAWLQSLGLDADETASIVTAKAWGSLYDIWIAENPEAAPSEPETNETDTASTPPEPESLADPAPTALTETAERPPTSPPREARRRHRRRSSVRRLPASPRSPPPWPEREVGPFGY